MTTRASTTQTDGRSGRDIAAQYVSQLQAACERLWQSGEPLPRLPTGEVNKSAVAAVCGFPRRVFATNPSALEKLNEWDARDRERHASMSDFDKARRVRERTSRSDEYTRKLERRVLELEAEVAGLRRQCARLATIEQLMIRTGKLP